MLETGGICDSDGRNQYQDIENKIHWKVRVRQFKGKVYILKLW